MFPISERSLNGGRAGELLLIQAIIVHLSCRQDRLRPHSNIRVDGFWHAETGPAVAALNTQLAFFGHSGRQFVPETMYRWLSSFYGVDWQRLVDGASCRDVSRVPVDAPTPEPTPGPTPEPEPTPDPTPEPEPTTVTSKKTPTIMLLDETGTVSRATLLSWRDSMQAQVDEDFAQWWGHCNVTVGTASDVDNDSWVLALRAESSLANAAGWHSIDSPDGLGVDPVGEVALNASPNQITKVISHEIVEMVADDFVNQFASVNANDLWLVETADPVQNTSYQKRGHTVSNFVTRAWFGAGNVDEDRGEYDHLGICSRPLQIAAGYQISYNPVSREFTFLYTAAAGAAGAASTMPHARARVKAVCDRLGIADPVINIKAV